MTAHGNACRSEVNEDEVFVETSVQRVMKRLLYKIKHRKEKIDECFMRKYLVLCCDGKDTIMAKEGLVQFKNICCKTERTDSVNYFKGVVLFFLKLIEEKTLEAKQASDEISSNPRFQSSTNVSECFLLRSVTADTVVERVEQVLLKPWILFLSESFQMCLKLLANNIMLEDAYHQTASKAFYFCLKYHLKTCFRKISDKINQHFRPRRANSTFPSDPASPQTQAQVMRTKLNQLLTAVCLELWEETFQTLQEICQLLRSSSTPPSLQVLSVYYQTLALVFWNSGNFLFHSAALSQLFIFSKDVLGKEQLQNLTCKVVTAILAVPVFEKRQVFLNVADISSEKCSRYADLLLLSEPPTRDSLIKTMVDSGSVSTVWPHLQDLYTCLEVDFDPLHLSQRAAGCLQIISRDDASHQQYIPLLRDVAFNKMLKQISEVYSSMEMFRLLTLSPFTDHLELELSVAEAAHSGYVQVRIDHRNECVHFYSDPRYWSAEEKVFVQSSPGDVFRNQLIAVSQVLDRAVERIQPDRSKASEETLRDRMVCSYKFSWRKERAAFIRRKQDLEERYEMLARRYAQTQPSETNAECSDVLINQSEEKIIGEKQEQPKKQKNEKKKQQQDSNGKTGKIKKPHPKDSDSTRLQQTNEQTENAKMANGNSNGQGTTNINSIRPEILELATGDSKGINVNEKGSKIFQRSRENSNNNNPRTNNTERIAAIQKRTVCRNSNKDRYRANNSGRYAAETSETRNKKKGEGMHGNEMLGESGRRHPVSKSTGISASPKLQRFSNSNELKYRVMEHACCDGSSTTAG